MSKINLQRGKLTVENRKSRENIRICSEVSVNSPGKSAENSVTLSIRPIPLLRIVIACIHYVIDKPEVHNMLHCPQKTCAEYLTKFGRVVLEICEPTDRQTHMLIAKPVRRQSNRQVTKK